MLNHFLKIVKKTKLSELNKDDKIFAMTVAYNKDKVNFIGYCDVVEIENIENSDYYHVSFEHKTKPVGVSSSIRKDRIDKPYVLFNFVSCAYFFTLNANTWKDDIKESLEHLLVIKTEEHNDDVKRTKERIDIYINSSDEIDSFINESSKK